ncbi:MAG: helix-turn-helix domain-containing protein [Fibrobacterota bacterium]|nr:helix-turn-helix domain-containing protein [Fibrobacterota bacterium]
MENQSIDTRPSRRVLYTVQEAAARLNCSDKTVYRRLKLGDLVGGKGPGGIRLNAARVEMLVQMIYEGKV